MRALIAAILISLASQAVAQESSKPVEQAERPADVNQPDDGPGTKQRESAGSTKSGNLCGPSYTLNCGPRAYPASQERNPEAERRDQRDLVAQESMAAATESMAYWTIVMAIAAVLSFIAAGAAAVFAYKIIGETRRIGVAQIRAYLTIKKVIVKFVNEDDPLFRISFNIENTGNSPATIVNCSIRTHIYVGNTVDTNKSRLFYIGGGDEWFAVPDIPGNNSDRRKFIIPKVDSSQIIGIDDIPLITFDIEFLCRFYDVFDEENRVIRAFRLIIDTPVVAGKNYELKPKASTIDELRTGAENYNSHRE